jgi:hypothetical protein
MDWDRDSNNKIVIGLMTGDRYWSQYAYQFAHEFCHAIANHSNGKKPLGRSLKDPYIWFEESICETASLFALREMGRTWEKAPPYPNWNTYAPSLKSYVQAIIDDPENMLPNGKNFQTWFISKQSKLKDEWTLRKNDKIIARQLLPLFEKNPYAWEAVAFLPNNNQSNDMTFPEFLLQWRKNCPPNLCSFVDEVAGVFAISLAKTSPAD